MATNAASAAVLTEDQANLIKYGRVATSTNSQLPGAFESVRDLLV